MKYFFFLFCTLKLSCAFSQADTTRFYYDKEFNEIKSAKKAIYFGKGFRIEDGRYKQIDYYSPQKIQMIGYYKDRNFKVEDGKFEYFYENGKHEIIEIFKKGKHIDKKTVFYENGQINTVYEYDNTTHERINVSYFKEDGSESIVTKPIFIGGTDEMMKFIQSNLSYPYEARKQNIEGKVSVKFLIKTDGLVGDVLILKSDNSLLNDEAKRVIKSMPKWTPGNRDGKPTNTFFSIPVNFILEN